MSEKAENEQLKTTEKRGNPIFRQELNNHTPKCDIKFAIICNTFLSLVFFGFGIPILISTAVVKEFQYDYTSCLIEKCTKIITIKETIPAPVFVYYELTNFYSNHRDYVKSKIWSQLRGETHINSKNNSNCEGAKLMKEMFDGNSLRYKTYKGRPLKGDDFANPCGLAAKAFFNDTYILSTKPEEPNKPRFINVSSKGIAATYDVDNVFKRINNSENLQWVDVEDERFIVWMQTETFPKFRKLWGVINEDIQPGFYTLQINNNYNALKFNGSKKFVLSNSTKLGSGGTIGLFFVFGGLFCVLVIILILILHLKNKDTELDFNLMKWE